MSSLRDTGHAVTCSFNFLLFRELVMTAHLYKKGMLLVGPLVQVHKSH